MAAPLVHLFASTAASRVVEIKPLPPLASGFSLESKDDVARDGAPCPCAEPAVEVSVGATELGEGLLNDRHP